MGDVTLLDGERDVGRPPNELDDPAVAFFTMLSRRSARRRPGTRTVSTRQKRQTASMAPTRWSAGG
jgi:hypothetical protein